MAIYRCSFQVFSRGQAHRACAAAAYRAGEKIYDDYYGLTHDFTKKGGVENSFILAPDNAPDWMKDRTQLWNGVEVAEKRKDSQLSREVLLSLPHELNLEQRAKLVQEFAKENFVSKGMIADCSLHNPEKKGDGRNYHAHIMLTTRDLMRDGFGKKNRSWNDKKFLEETREKWAEAQNRTFEKLGLDVRVDHRSLEDQGIDREPEPKLGSFASKAKRDGHPEKASRVIDNFNEVANRNKQRAELQNQAEIIDLALARLEKAGGDKSKEEGAEIALKHSEEMKLLQERQGQEKQDFKEQEQAKIEQAKKDAKARVKEARKAERPSALGRGFEVLTFRGKSAQHKRQEHHEERKQSEQSQLNHLRKDARERLEKIEKSQEKERKELHQKQTIARQRLERQLKKAEERLQRKEARKAEREREAKQNALTPEQRQERAIARQEARKDRERRYGRGGRERSLGR